MPVKPNYEGLLRNLWREGTLEHWNEGQDFSPRYHALRGNASPDALRRQ